MKPIVHTEVVHCQSDRARLWKAVSDTHRFNEAIGFAPFQIDPTARGAARQSIRTRQGPFQVTMEEEPFEWVELERFSVHRSMKVGPVSSVEARFEFALEGSGGTTLTVSGIITPKQVWMRPITAFVLRRSIRQLARGIQELDRVLQAGGDAMPARARALVKSDTLAVTRAAFEAAVAGDPAALDVARRVSEVVASAPDVDVSRIRPYELADRWGLDRRLVLETFLHGAVAGLLELRWEIICPSCQTSTDQVPTLSDIQAHAACHVCDLQFGLDLDRGVEAAFRPRPAVREVPALQFCTGGPGATPHVIAQAVVGPGRDAVLPTPAEAGRYRLFARGGATASVEVRDGGAGDGASLTLSEGGFSEKSVTVAPGTELRISNAGDSLHVKLERLTYASKAATAYDISLLPAFRRLFSGEVLKPGVALRVTRASLLFTDLAGSTALYTSEGDAVAFRLVQDHFDVLRAVVESHEGTVVKTIGDSVMAAFRDDVALVKAALAMQDAFLEFVKSREPPPPVRLRVGVFSGPCYAVTANGILDYFGQSVNTAARLEGQARGGEVVLPAELGERALGGGWIPADTAVEAFAAVLKGIEKPVAAVRIMTRGWWPPKAGA